MSKKTDHTALAVETIRRWREAPQIMVRELFGVEPDKWQDDALAAFPKSPRLAMRACVGPGKLESVSTVIETPIGERRWGDLKPGDEVFAEDGSVTKIVRTFPHGVQPIFRVTFDDGSFARVGADHLWKVRGRTERRHLKLRRSGRWTERTEANILAQAKFITPEDGYSVLTTMQIVERGVMTINRSAPAKQFEIPTQGAVQFPRAEQPLDPYLAGVWIGDGHVRSPRYTKPYIEVEDEIRRRGYQTERREDGKLVVIKDAGQKFAQLACYDCRSPERFIPDNYKRASIEQRTDLLCGLMDTDGCIGDDAHMEYSTTSETLANDVVWLVRSLGGVALIKAAIKKGWYRDENGVRIDCKDCYRVTVTLPFNPFRIAHKRNRWHMPQQRYLTRYIASIEPDGEEEAMCIEIDHPSHCYLTRDFIVTHNTAVLAWLGWNFLLTRPHPMIGATSVTSANLKSNLRAELARWRGKATSPLLETMFELTSEAIFAREARDTWKLEFRSWPKDADEQQIGNSLAGLHAAYIMWLLDETGDYPEAVLPVCEGIFSGMPIEAHIVQAGNPTRRRGPLWRAATTARDLWKLITITADPDDPNRTPRVSIEVAREQIRQYGRDNPWVKVRILGEFPDSDFNALIGPDEVEAAMKRLYTPYDLQNMPVILGVDVAREGDDQSVIFPRKGKQGFVVTKMRNVDSIQGAGRVSRIWSDTGADGVFVDATGGFGSGWIDQLRVLNRDPIGIHFSGEAIKKERYFNKRTEIYFEAVQWIKEGGALPHEPEIVAALSQTNYAFHKDRLLLEPKEAVKAKLGYSPDITDALCLTFSFPVAVKASKPSAPPASQHTANYDPFSPGHLGPLGQTVAASYDPFDLRRR